jgi:hypothetical protein
VDDIRTPSTDRRRDSAQRTRMRIAGDGNLERLHVRGRSSIEERARLLARHQDHHRDRVTRRRERGEERQEMSFAPADALHLLNVQAAHTDHAAESRTAKDTAKRAGRWSERSKRRARKRDEPRRVDCSSTPAFNVASFPMVDTRSVRFDRDSDARIPLASASGTTHGTARYRRNALPNARTAAGDTPL